MKDARVGLIYKNLALNQVAAEFDEARKQFGPRRLYAHAWGQLEKSRRKRKRAQRERVSASPVG